MARDGQAFRLDQHARRRRSAQARGCCAHHRAPALGFGVDLIFAVMLALEAIQSGQQDRSWQAGGKEGHWAAGDDSDELIAPGEFSEEPGDPGQWLGERGMTPDVTSPASRAAPAAASAYGRHRGWVKIPSRQAKPHWWIEPHTSR